MAAVIIRKRDVERLGKELVKEIYEFLHDEYILNNFIEMKLVQQKFLRNLVTNYFRTFNNTVTQKGNSWSIKYEEFDESKYEKELKCLKDEIENGSLSTFVIFKTLNNLDLDMEINEDLYFKKEAFLNIFKVFDGNYSYLED